MQEINSYYDLEKVLNKCYDTFYYNVLVPLKKLENNFTLDVLKNNNALYMVDLKPYISEYQCIHNEVLSLRADLTIIIFHCIKYDQIKNRDDLYQIVELCNDYLAYKTELLIDADNVPHVIMTKADARYYKKLYTTMLQKGKIFISKVSKSKKLNN